MAHSQSGNPFVRLLLLLISSAFCFAQVARIDGNSIPDYDIREFMAEGARNQPGSTPQSQARLTVERRAANVRAFLAAQAAPERGSRDSLTRFGLPKVLLREGRTLTGSSTLPPEQIAMRFLESNAALYEFTAQERAGLRLAMRDAGRDATYLVYEQTVGGIPVYEGQIKFVLSRAGEVIQVAAGGIAPGLSLATVPQLSAQQAVRAAYASLDPMQQPVLTQAATAQGNTTFPNPGGPQFRPIAASLVIFPSSATTARLAYRIYLELDPQRSYEILIDGQDGSLLYRRNLVLYEARGYVFPESPLASKRELVSFPPVPASGPAPDAWLAPDALITTGNNVDAFLDADGNGSPDTGAIAGLQNGRAYSSTQSFEFPYEDASSGQDPRSFQAAAVTNLFYLVNTAHDYFYRLGFTEASANFQIDNHARGGLGNDAVKARAQSLSAQNNAAFSPTPEGIAPSITVGIFTRGTPDLADDLDADYDGGVIIHEYAHGVSTRLVGAGTNMGCLAKPMAGAMGEGWSDYFAASFYSNPVMGAFVTADPVRGVRRHSYEGYPYTYEDLGNGGYEVHRDGEIWAATLWDLRKTLGQAVTDKLVMDGLKGTPCNPTMPDARDAILAADMASNGGANRAAIWTVFAGHGLGYSAFGVDGYTSTGIRYDAAYDRPPDLQGVGNPAVTSDPFSFKVGLDDDYPYIVQATNPNGGTLSYQLLAGPEGMSIDPATGKITWRVTFTGKRIKIAVTDGKNGKVVHGYLLPVLTELTPGVPRIISGEGNSAGQGFLNIPANVPVIQATVRNTSASLLVMLGGTGKGGFYGGKTPTAYVAGPASGKWNLLVAGGGQAYSNAVLTVSLVTPQPLLTRAPLTGISGDFGSDKYYSVTVPAGASELTVSTTGGTGNVDLDLRMPYPPTGYYNVAAGRLTSDNNETATIDNPAPGEWFIHLHGTDEYANVTLAFSLGALAIGPDSPLPSGRVGAAYAQTLTATGGSPPYSWSVSAGSLPPGLTLSSGGVLSGIPTAAGSYKWIVRVADSAATPAVSTLEYSLRIEGTEITSLAALPDGFVGGSYSQNLTAIGGLPPYIWSLISGTLPSGLSLSSSGLLSGIPTQSGLFTFTAQVQGAENITAVRTFTLRLMDNPGSLPRKGVFSQIAAGDGWNTEIWLTNNAGVPQPVRIAFYGRGGVAGLQSAEGASPITPFQVEQQGSISIVAAKTIDAVLPAKGTLVLKTRDVPAGVQGWAEVLSYGDLEGFAVFRSSNVGQGVAPLQKETTKQYLVIPFDNTAGQSAMGVALANVGSANTTVSASAWDDSGNFLGSVFVACAGSATWPSFAHMSFMLGEYLGLTTGKRGHIDFHAESGALTGVALKVDLVNSVFVSVPAVPR